MKGIVLAEKINDKEINETLIKYVKDRPGHDRRYAIDATKMCSELNLEPTINKSDGIQKMLGWAREY